MISVIIPVYNAEDYIDRCVKSIMNQDYNDWELILVDDGSKDSSPQIVDKWKREDKRIKTIHQMNAGPGEARNRGILEATGEFVVYVDADDYLSSEYFSLLVKKMKQADVVFIDVLQVDSKGNVLSKELMSAYKEWNKDKILRAQMTGKIPWGGVRKAVRRSLIVDNNIFYTKHSIGEEALYSMKLLLYAEKVAFIDEMPVYYYVNHCGSQSKIKTDDPWGGVVEIIKNYLTSQSLIRKYGNTLNAFSVTATIVSIDRICSNYSNKNMIKKKIKERVGSYKQGLIENVGMDYRSMDYKALFMYPFLKSGWVLPIVLIAKIRGGIKR